MWVKDIGNKSFYFAYKLVDLTEESIVYATGESVQVCYDYKKEKSMAVSDEMRETLSQYLRKGNPY